VVEMKNKSLDAYREQIDQIDDDLVRLFQERMEVAGEIAKYKKENHLPVLDTARERSKLADVQKKANKEFETYTAALYSLLFELSRSYQEKQIDEKEKQVTPTRELQALGFAVQELALYLDTHRDDMEALEVYREYQRMYNHCRDEFLKKHGPLNHFQEDPSDKYNWLNDPWPWEYCRNKEV
jgi:monofunctional chorismate mutase